MEQWRKDARKEPIIIDIDSLVPSDHLLRKIEKVMDYEWIYERLDPYYNHNNGRPGTDPVVLIKMVLIQHLFGIPSLRQTHREIQVNLAYRWFLGYGLLDLSSARVPPSASGATACPGAPPSAKYPRKPSRSNSISRALVPLKSTTRWILRRRWGTPQY